MVDLQNDPRFNIHAIAENKKNELDSFVAHLYCCHSTGCKSSGADDLLLTALGYRRIGKNV